MESNIMNYINKIEGYKTAIKSMHWDASNMSEHKLWDDIADAVNDIQDNVSEMAQGIYGQISKNTLKPIQYNIGSKEKFLDDLLDSSKEFYKSLSDKDEYIGIRSEMENFIGQVNKFKYLLKISLKEDFKRNFRKKLNERRNTIKLSESELSEYITECVQKSLQRIKKKH